jgi:hypothetical protein
MDYRTAINYIQACGFRLRDINVSCEASVIKQAHELKQQHSKKENKNEIDDE